MSKKNPIFDFLKLRKTYGLTQSDLGDLLKVSKNYICQIETGRKIPSDTLIALSQRLENELAEGVPLGVDGVGAPGPSPRRQALQYLDELFSASGDDLAVQGYILTRLKMAFPMDQPPFVKPGVPKGDSSN